MTKVERLVTFTEDFIGRSLCQLTPFVALPNKCSFEDINSEKKILSRCSKMALFLNTTSEVVSPNARTAQDSR